MTARRLAISGVAVVVVYLVVLTITVGMHDSHVRPLYDGFAPPPAYSWVDPPDFFAAGNVEPEAVSAVVAFGAAGSEAAGVATPDGQFVLDVGPGAIAPHGADRSVRVAITPLDPKPLAAIPLGLRPNGNAYRVEMHYEPSKTPVVAIAKPGSLLIEMPEIGDRLFTSSNGRRWSALTAHGVSNRLSLTTAFSRPGYYVAATNLPELSGAESGSSRRSIELGTIVAALAVVVLLAGFIARRRLHARRS